MTDLERKSLAGERELLTMLTSYPDLFRTYADRICSIEWVDPRHESIAWAVLATPPGTDPAACMDAARAVCPEAASLVSAGRISATSKHPTETNIVFMLDTLELYTIKRRMRAAQAKLRQDRSLDDEARRVLTMQADAGFAASARTAKVDRRRGRPVPFDRPGGRRHRSGLDVVVNQRILAYIQSSILGIDVNVCAKVLSPVDYEGRICAKKD